MANTKIPDINFPNAEIWYRNFAGIEKQYNPAGDRNFEVRFKDLELAQTLMDDGWNVKIVLPEDGSDRQPYAKLKVKVEFEHKPARIFIVEDDELVPLGPETVGCLDYADIENIDLVIRPRFWENVRGSGIKAYLRTAYVTLERDAFHEKYAGCRVRR